MLKKYQDGCCFYQDEINNESNIIFFLALNTFIQVSVTLVEAPLKLLFIKLYCHISLSVLSTFR